MKKETIAMPDGRYLIYYSFDDEPKVKPAVAAENNPTVDAPEKKDV